jgi:hypothetical protein
MLPLFLAAGTALAQGIAAALNKPVHQTIPVDEIMQQGRANAFQDANQAVSNAGLQIGPQMAARGLQNSGIPAIVLGNVQQGAYGQALRGLAQMRTGLMGQQAALDNQYRREKAAYLPNVLGSIANIGGAAAGYAQEQENFTKNAGLLRELYGTQPQGQSDTYNWAGAPPTSYRPKQVQSVRPAMSYTDRLKMIFPQARFEMAPAWEGQ